VSGFDAAHGVEDVVIDDLSYLGRRLRTPAEARFVTDFAPGFELR
jgi:hypothetical protein